MKDLIIPDSCPAINKIEDLLAEMCNKNNKNKINEIGSLLEEVREINKSLRSELLIIKAINNVLRKKLGIFK